MSLKKILYTSVVAASLALGITSCYETKTEQQNTPTKQYSQNYNPKPTSTPNGPWDGTKEYCENAGGVYIQSKCSILGFNVVIHTVKEGENLWGIANLYGIKHWNEFLSEFKLYNSQINQDQIKAGQELIIPLER